MFIFLVTVFVVNGGTITLVQPMPDIDTCNKAKQIQLETARPAGWTTTGISKPVLVKCESK